METTIEIKNINDKIESPNHRLIYQTCFDTMLFNLDLDSELYNALKEQLQHRIKIYVSQIHLPI